MIAARGDRAERSFMSGFDIFVFAFVVLAILIIVAGVKTVPQGYNFTVERFGKYTRTLVPGLTLIVPFIDRVGRKVNMMEQVLDVPSQEVITRDNASVRVDGVNFYQVVDAARASYEVNNLTAAVLNLTMTNIRSVMGSMDLDAVLSQRDEINERLLRVVDAAASPWGIKITRIEIKDITPPADLIAAMGRQMKAEREKRAAVLESEGLRQSEILRAEGRKQAQVLEAEGRKEAAFRDAEARERSAEAEARATTMVSEAVARGDLAALNYFIADKYVRALEKVAAAPNQKTLILPMEMTAVIGSLAGLAEIAKSALAPTPPSGAAGPRGTVPAVGTPPETRL
jgi:regulator of protease activity HflC (stomatin/prohibitin superfamily)